MPGRDRRRRPATGTLVDLYTCNGTGAQVWQPQSGGALLNPQSGKCLDDTGFSTTPGHPGADLELHRGGQQSWVSREGRDQPSWSRIRASISRAGSRRAACTHNWSMTAA